ncbi:hypothetical protein Tco_0329732, partial [Tanacetum coccineum]
AGQNENVVEEVVDAAQVSIVATTDLKSTKPKAKGIAFREPDQLKLDEEIALKLQSEIDEEERNARAEE